jgi:hypothetical protein
VPFVSSPDFDLSKDVLFERLGGLLSGDFGSDARSASAVSSSGTALAVSRLVSGLDLGCIVLVPGVSADGRLVDEALVLTLDAGSYSSAEIFELSTGRSRRLDLPSSAAPPRLSLSSKNGPLLLRLTAREKASGEAPKAAVAVAEKRGLTAEEILARHQAWRAERDARWSRLAGRNTMSIRFRFANLNNTPDSLSPARSSTRRAAGARIAGARQPTACWKARSHPSFRSSARKAPETARADVRRRGTATS